MAKKKRIRLLVITRHPPLPDHDGAGAYLFDFLCYLKSHGAEVEVAWTTPYGEWIRNGWWLPAREIRKIFRLRFPGSLAVGPWHWFGWGSKKARWLHRIRKLIGRARNVNDHAPRPPTLPVAGPAVAKPSHWTDPPSAGDLKFFKRQINRFRPTAILANYCWMTPGFQSASEKVQRLVLTCDVISERLTQSSGNPAALTKAKEASLLSAADFLLAITPEDAAAFREMLPAHPVILTSKAAVLQPISRSDRQLGRCLFVGSNNEPNRLGLAWFIREIWPIVLQRCPQANLQIAGNVEIANPVTADSSILCSGRVADLAPLYAQASVVIVPLLHGSGMKIKVVEAAAHHSAIVTTPVGLQGLGFLNEAVSVRNSPEDFAEAVCELLDSPPEIERQADQAHALVKKHLSPDACYGPALQVLRNSTR